MLCTIYMLGAYISFSKRFARDKTRRCKYVVHNKYTVSLPTTTTMGKLNIAHHKSYHPYRLDNITRVKRDEEEARIKEEQEEGRMMLAVCHRIFAL